MSLCSASVMDASPSLSLGRLRTAATAFAVLALGIGVPLCAMADPCPPDENITRPPCYVWDDGICEWVPGPASEPAPGPCLVWDSTICDWVSQAPVEGCPTGEIWQAGTMQNPVCACVPCTVEVAPPSPGPCYVLNAANCSWELPAQPGPCWTWHAPQCGWVEHEPPPQTSECQTWNEGACSWELPPQPEPCWILDEGDCQWHAPAAPEGCWMPDPENACGWLPMDENCSAPYSWNPATCQCECDPGPEAEGCWHLSENGCEWLADTQCGPGEMMNAACECVPCEPGPQPTNMTCPVVTVDNCGWEEKSCPPGHVMVDCECVECDPGEQGFCTVLSEDGCSWVPYVEECTEGNTVWSSEVCACVPTCPGEPSPPAPPPCTIWDTDACNYIEDTRLIVDCMEPPYGPCYSWVYAAGSLCGYCRYNYDPCGDCP